MAHRVLVVDTDSRALADEAATLAAAGYLVTCARDFAAARRRLQLAPPDLLLANVRLGPYNGLHLVHLLRLANPTVPAILRNVSPDPVLEREARVAGATYLVDPVPPAALIAVVKTRLAGRPIDPATDAARRSCQRYVQLPIALVMPQHGGVSLHGLSVQSKWTRDVPNGEIGDRRTEVPWRDDVEAIGIAAADERVQVN